MTRPLCFVLMAFGRKPDPADGWRTSTACTRSSPLHHRASRPRMEPLRAN